MAKLETTYVPKDFRVYIPKAIKNVMSIEPGDTIDWYFGTDIDARAILAKEHERQQVIVLHVRNS